MLSLAQPILAAAALLAAPAFAATPDALSLAVAKQQFINAKIVPDAISSFNPTALLQVTFPNVGNLTNGKNLTQDQAKPAPTVTAIGNFNSSAYTIMMVDADYVGSSDNGSLNVHWLQNGATIGSNGQVSGGNGPVAYAGPAPPSGSGGHRYTILLFAQPSSFQAPATPKSGSGVMKLTISDYLSQAKLGSPLAGLYFEVQVGTPTVAVQATSPVNTASLSVSATGSGSPSGSSSAAGGQSTGQPHSGASKVSAASLSGGALVGLLFATFLAF